LETVVDHSGLDRFVLTGFSSGASVAVAYAGRHPQRVSRLVLQGGAARGRRHRTVPETQKEMDDTISNLLRFSLRHRNPFDRLFATIFIPDSRPDQVQWLQRTQPASARDAAELMRVIWDINVVADARRIACPTLVLHSTADALTPFDEGRNLAGLIPKARLIPLESRNHVVLEREPAWAEWVSAVRGFLPVDVRGTGTLDSLSRRERDLVRLLAQGLDNLQIAARLSLSEKTVRNVVSRVYDKLGVENRGQAIVLARELGCLD
jgi:pimeloyl-ACP methyl ester carboxylesterase/DNA-binding CsgD family transcriptional regulator